MLPQRQRDWKGNRRFISSSPATGSATAGGQTVDLYRNIAVLMPANLEFTLKNTGEEPLAMYVINEPTPPGFRPNSTMLVRDENKIPITSSDGHVGPHRKTLFVTRTDWEHCKVFSQ